MSGKIPDFFNETEDRILLKYVFDLYEKYLEYGISKYTGFLNEYQQKIVKNYFSGLKFNGYSFYGGYEGADRKICCIGDEGDFPIAVIHAVCDKALLHRDILGAVLGLSIKREKIGDIKKSENGFYIFLDDKISRYIEDNFKNAGPANVKCSLYYGDLIFEEGEFSVIEDSVMSLRLDNVLASALKMSRKEAVKLILSKRCFVNNKCVYDVDYKLKSGDKFSVKGFGKFILEESGQKSRKNKTFITIYKYL